MTLKEIAKRAGVSASTVSRIINSPTGNFARKEIQDRVWSIIRETNYAPNRIAQDLRLGRSGISKNTFGTLSCILGRSKNIEENPFYENLMRVFGQQAIDHHFHIKYVHSAQELESQATMPLMNLQNSDGFIILGLVDDTIISHLQQFSKNIIYIGRNPVGTNVDQVICDGYASAQLAIEHLIANGHQRIAYIGETQHEVRYQAYLDMVHVHQLHTDNLLICDSPHSEKGGYFGADTLLHTCTPLPTAVFCSTDVAAIAVLQRFAEAKLKVPSDISIVSMDNIEASSLVSPMLSTVETPYTELGCVAVQILMARIHKLHKLPLKVYLPHKLLVRESVLNLNRGMYI